MAAHETVVVRRLWHNPQSLAATAPFVASFNQDLFAGDSDFVRALLVRVLYIELEYGLPGVRLGARPLIEKHATPWVVLYWALHHALFPAYDHDLAHHFRLGQFPHTYSEHSLYPHSTLANSTMTTLASDSELFAARSPEYKSWFPLDRFPQGSLSQINRPMDKHRSRFLEVYRHLSRSADTWDADPLEVVMPQVLVEAAATTTAKGSAAAAAAHSRSSSARAARTVV